jgi:SAM-dependent methyltransferase
MPLPKIYSDLASWFHLLTAPEDYEEEAAAYTKLLIDACEAPPRKILELGSGGGNNASHMRKYFELTLTDISPEMLELSGTINPDCEHVAGDMRTLRLNRDFDAVFVHDAVAYMTSEGDLRSAIETAALHTRPGGAVLFVPDYVRETFAPGTSHGGHDAADGRGLRYLEWCWDPDPDDSTYVADYSVLLRETDGGVRTYHDRHVEGLFPRETWLRLLRESGVEARSERVVLEDAVVEAFVGHKAG